MDAVSLDYNVRTFEGNRFRDSHLIQTKGTMMSHHDRATASRTRPLLAAALLLAIALPVRAEDKKADSSLGLIPANAAYYSAMLRNKEQLDAVANSKAWARITKLPYYQMGMRLLKQQYEEGENFAAFRQWVGQEENRDLVELLGDAVSTEIFCYGAGNWVDFVDLWQQVSRGMQLAPYTQLLKDPKSKDPKAMQYASGRAVLRVLARNPNKIKIPDFIIGFKIKDARKAEAQIKRLETVLKDLAAVQPMLQDRVKRVKVGESSFLSLSFDGSMIPWDEIDWKDVEEAAGEFDGVRKNLKKLKLTINLGVRGDYLLLSIGSTTEGIKQLGGEGPRLTSLAELKPLVRAAGKRLTGISYSSKALAAKSKMSADDIDNLATMAGHALDAAGIPENKRKAIMKDVSGLAGDLKKELTPAGASLSFSYLSERGYEGYDYQYGEFPYLDSSKPLTLLNHVGGDPILAVVGRSKGTLERYQTMSKWIKTAFGHAEPLILEKLGEQEKQKYEEVSKLVFPLLKRFDEITGKMLLPSLEDGQAGFVLDGKWKSKQWHPAMPPSDKELPMLELALLVGVSDRALLEKAMKSYGKLIEDALEKIKENAPPDAQPPITKLQAPEVKEVKAGKLYIWPLPKEAQLDRRVAVTGGLSDKVGLVTLSAEHAQRLLTAKPLKVEGGPLADTKRPLTAATYFNWPVFIDTLSPWVMYAMEKANLEKNLAGNDEDAQKKTKEEIIRHVRVVLGALKALRISTSATYVEEGRSSRTAKWSSATSEPKTKKN